MKQLGIFLINSKVLIKYNSKQSSWISSEFQNYYDTNESPSLRLLPNYSYKIFINLATTSTLRLFPSKR